MRFFPWKPIPESGLPAFSALAELERDDDAACIPVGGVAGNVFAAFGIELPLTVARARELHTISCVELSTPIS